LAKIAAVPKDWQDFVARYCRGVVFEGHTHAFCDTPLVNALFDGLRMQKSFL
jgi:hypothetical protein